MIFLTRKIVRRGYKLEYKKSPLKAIRAKCLECSNDSSNEVKTCTVENCYLYPFRFGKNPYRTKRVLTEEQKEAARNRLKKARESIRHYF